MHPTLLMRQKRPLQMNAYGDRAARAAV
jgi:hypothetical protein